MANTLDLQLRLHRLSLHDSWTDEQQAVIVSMYARIETIYETLLTTAAAAETEWEDVVYWLVGDEDRR